MIKEKKTQQLKIIAVLARWILKLIGWKMVGERPGIPKYVMLGYPHTSNWDVPIGLLIFAAAGVRLNWVGKHTLFKKPFGWVIRLIGGVPVNRDTTKNFVQLVADVFDSRKELVLTVSPEGTRGKAEFWRSGFYYIALAAGIPIALAFLDYGNKTGGFGPIIMPSGDIKSDFEKIRKFYAGMKGKKPQDMTPIILRPDSEEVQKKK